MHGTKEETRRCGNGLKNKKSCIKQKFFLKYRSPVRVTLPFTISGTCSFWIVLTTSIDPGIVSDGQFLLIVKLSIK